MKSEDKKNIKYIYIGVYFENTTLSTLNRIWTAAVKLTKIYGQHTYDRGSKIQKNLIQFIKTPTNLPYSTDKQRYTKKVDSVVDRIGLYSLENLKIIIK